MTEIKELEGEVACLKVTSSIENLGKILNENDNKVDRKDLVDSFATIYEFLDKNTWRVLDG